VLDLGRGKLLVGFAPEIYSAAMARKTDVSAQRVIGVRVDRSRQKFVARNIASN